MIVEANLDTNFSQEEELLTNERYFVELNEGLKLAEELNKRRKNGENLAEFDVRAALYGLALKFAPKARTQDLEYLKQWLRPQNGEVGADVAAGTGFISFFLAQETGASVYAIDPSRGQIDILEANRHKNEVLGALIKPIVEFPDTDNFIQNVSYNYGDELEGAMDYVTGYGGDHHSKYLKMLYVNKARMLRLGGRLVGADVGAKTALSAYFDNVVAKDCLTGHDGNWISIKKLKQFEKELPLKLVRTEIVGVQWRFRNNLECYLFFAGLHAYPNGLRRVFDGLDRYLNLRIESVNGKNMTVIDWPMRFFEMIRIPGQV